MGQGYEVGRLPTGTRERGRNSLRAAAARAVRGKALLPCPQGANLYSDSSPNPPFPCSPKTVYRAPLSPFTVLP